MRNDNNDTLSFFVLMGLPLCINLTGREAPAPGRRSVGLEWTWNSCLAGAADGDEEGFRIKWALLALLRMAPPKRILSMEAPANVERP